MLKISAVLLALASIALAQTPLPCSVPKAKLPADTFCLDLKKPVTPLDAEVDAGKQFRIQVFHKTPWQKVTHEEKLSEIEDPAAKELAGIIGFVGKALGTAPLTTKMTNGEFVTEMVRPASRTPETLDAAEPFRSAFGTLALRQAALRQDLGPRRDDAGDVKSNLTKLKSAGKLASAEECKSAKGQSCFDNIKDATTDFAAKLGTWKTKIPEDKDPLSTQETAALLARAKSLTDSALFAGQSPVNQGKIERALQAAMQAELELEAAVSELTAAEAGYGAARDLAEALVSEKDSWYQQEFVFENPANRKAEFTIKALNRASTDKDAKEIVKFNVTWRHKLPISVSLGFALSFLAKDEFDLQSSRVQGLNLTDPNPLKYSIRKTTTRPVAFPLVLFHYNVPALTTSRWGFALTGGAGADVTGSSPTGEFVFGGSLRYGSLYISPLIHSGRRKTLQEGFAVSNPAPADFKPPVQDVWGHKFAVAITLKIPTLLK